jgi:hypothetical protein
MKSEILKIAGVKDEKSFYKKYPSEEAFMKVHGKSFKKAQMGTEITKAQTGSMIPGMGNYLQGFGNVPNVQNMLQGQSQSPGVNSNMFPSPPNYDQQYMNMSTADEKLKPLGSEKSSAFSKAQPYINAGLDVFNGIQSLGAEKKAALQAKQSRMVSDVALKASLTRPEMPQRKYVRPEDHVTSGDEFYPIHGVGSNVLARDGANITNRTYGPGEIQNTYAPNDIYEDLGYEPLNDTNRQKSFEDGGTLDPSGFSDFMTGGGGTALTSLSSTMSGKNAGSQIGGGLGSAAGMAIGGPLGAQVGNFLGTTVGGLLDPYAKRQKKEQAATKRNMEKMMIGQSTASIQANNASYMENGGYVSNDWTPQVISMFGDHSPEDVYEYAHEGMESLRTGGNVRQNNMFETDQYALGGELKTHWGGYAETMSHNPYLPDGGETVMFRGKSHEERSPNGETGIGITYGDNPVEVERGEPAVKLQDGTSGDSNLTVFGNLKIPNQYIDLLGDKNAKGKKFKNYIADISKQEAKQNKLIEKSTNELNELEPITMIDKLKLTALQANINGANMKLKEFADKKINAASLQNAINDTAEEHSLDADSLAKGQVKQAKFGGSFDKAQDGKKIPKFGSASEARAKGYTKNAKGEWERWEKGVKKAATVTKSAKAMENIPKQSIDKTSGLFGGVTPAQFEAYKKKNAWYPNWDKFDPNRPEDVNDYAKAFNEEATKRGSTARVMADKNAEGKTKYVGKQFVSAMLEDKEEPQPSAPVRQVAEVEDVETTPIPYKRSMFLDAVGQVLPYIRPTDQEELDAAQLYPEMFAMATNQLEPVDAQGYQPELSTPYDISYQDQLNANQADYRATQRAVGYNPAALAQLNAQKYAANSNVLGEQFRANQAMKDKVYGENRNILNDAKLKNLDIFDRQYGRQAQALSNTKATSQAAISSIADKYAKNKLENRTLGVMENMYNYRFDPSGRAINMNAPWQPNIPTIGAAKGGQRQVPVYDNNGKLKSYQLEAFDPNAVEEDTTEYATTPVKPITEKKRNGAIVKAFKNY